MPDYHLRLVRVAIRDSETVNIGGRFYRVEEEDGSDGSNEGVHPMRKDVVVGLWEIIGNMPTPEVIDLTIRIK